MVWCGAVWRGAVFGGREGQREEEAGGGEGEEGGRERWRVVVVVLTRSLTVWVSVQPPARLHHVRSHVPVDMAPGPCVQASKNRPHNCGSHQSHGQRQARHGQASNRKCAVTNGKDVVVRHHPAHSCCPTQATLSRSSYHLQR